MRKKSATEIGKRKTVIWIWVGKSFTQRRSCASQTLARTRQKAALDSAKKVEISLESVKTHLRRGIEPPT